MRWPILWSMCVLAWLALGCDQGGSGGDDDDVSADDDDASDDDASDDDAGDDDTVFDPLSGARKPRPMSCRTSPHIRRRPTCYTTPMEIR